MSKDTKHEHSFDEVVLRPDRPHSEAEAIQAKNYNKGKRWIKGRKCKCGLFQAFDLTHQAPPQTSELPKEEAV